LLRVAKKIKKNRTRDRTNSAALLSLTLSSGVTLTLVNALVTALGKALMLVSLIVVLATALGILFRLQVVDFDIRFLFLVSHVCYLSFVGLFVDCVVSVAPKSN